MQMRAEDGTIWLTQKQIAELFDKDVRTVNEHIKNILKEGELDENSVIRNFRITATDGKTYDTAHYRLEMILAVGYRVRSPRGTQFRQWATSTLREYLVKGFAMEGIVSPAYTIVTPKENVDAEFMALLFKSLPVVHLFHRHSQGLVDDTLNLKWRHFAEIKVTIPEKAEQQAITAVFKTADRELDLLRSQLDALREQKKGLMQQLLTGKIRVKV